jgi:hypothetical protein
MDELDKKIKSYKNFKTIIFLKKVVKQKTHFRSQLTKKICSMNSKMFYFRCAKFDSTPTLVQISN